jgi:mono/diheme cytochrome c family protein
VKLTTIIKTQVIMKKALKIAGIGIGSILLLLVIAAAVINFRGIPTYDVVVPDVQIEYTPERIERGAYLANMVCVGCHISNNRVLEGKHMEDVPAAFGTVYSANITSHPEKGLGQYSDGQLVYLLRTGLSKDGNYIPPYMSKFPHMSDEDLFSIIAWLRASEAPVLAASDHTPPKTQPSFLVKLLSNFAFQPFPYPEAAIPQVDTNTIVEYGAYISNAVLECYSCHSASFTTNNALDPAQSVGFFGGGNKMIDHLEGIPVYSANVTMDKETGIGAWTLDEFKNAVRFGQHPEGNALSVVMPKYTTMKDRDLEAIYEYLKTVPPIKNVELKSLRAGTSE